MATKKWYYDPNNSMKDTDANKYFVEITNHMKLCICSRKFHLKPWIIEKSQKILQELSEYNNE